VRDAAYFAGLIVLSADAGLMGDPARERKLLLHYWTEFAEHVPPAQALAVAAEVKKLVTAAGKFYQEQVDSGDYGAFLDGLSKPEQYLKPELRGTLHWPTYAAIWPFDFDAREAFGQAQGGGGKADAAAFEKELPRYPHDYLRKLLADPQGGPGDPTLVETMRLRQSVLRYYARLQDPPADLARQLAGLQREYLGWLERKGPETWDGDFVVEAVAVLEALARAGADAALRQDANRLLLQYVRQARLNAGERDAPAPAAAAAPAAPVTFCSLRLAGPRVVFVCEPGELDDFMVVNFVRQELANAVRALAPPARFDVRLYGTLKAGAKSAAFGDVRAVDAASQRAALAYVEGIKDSADRVGDEPQEIGLGAALVAALAGWSADDAGAGDVVVVCYGRQPKIAAPVLDQLRQRPAGRPRIHLVGLHPVPTLGALVRHSGGSAVLLEEGDLLQVTPKRWNP
jgi:hypothetical protein